MLLSGRPALAESAVSDAIEQLDLANASGEELVLASARFAIAASVAAPDDAPTGLPLELERVLRLPSPLRGSFVLRHMIGLSREECAEFRIDNIDLNAAAAAEQLAYPLQ
jgi:hypothetical protein